MGAHRAKPDYARHFGDKLRQGIKIAGALKGMYDIGSTIYKGVQIAAPLIAGLL